MTGTPRPTPAPIPMPHSPAPPATALSPGAHVCVSMRTVGWLSAWSLIVRMGEETVTHSGSYDVWHDSAGETMDAAGDSLGRWIAETLGDLGVAVTIYIDAAPASTHALRRRLKNRPIFTHVSAPSLMEDRVQTREMMNAEAMTHPQHVEVWTDASLGFTRHVVGVGWVVCSNSGRSVISARSMAFNVDKERFNSNVAELHAIFHALTAVTALLDDPWCKDWSVLLRTDSRTAIDYVGRAARNADMGTDKRLEVIAQACQRRVEQLGATLAWVRGHDGNVHNDLADRLAVFARRSVEFNVPHAVRSSTLERLRKDARQLTRTTGKAS